MLAARSASVALGRRGVFGSRGAALSSRLSRMRRFHTRTAQAIMIVMADRPVSRHQPRSIETRAASFNVAFDQRERSGLSAKGDKGGLRGAKGG